MTQERAFEFMVLMLKQFVLTDDYPIFKKLGVSAEHFPAEFRSQASDFERIAKKNLSLAKIKFAAKFGDLPGKFERLSVGSVANNYHASAKAIRCYEFLEKVRRSPLDADRLAAELLRAKADSVGLHDLKSALDLTLKQIADSIANGTFERIIPFWENLSKTVGGVNPGCVFVITAKTGVGKTALALNIASCALTEMNVLYFNMEMLLTDVVKRIFMSNGHVTRRELSSGSFVNNSQKFQQWYSKTIGNENSFLISDGRALSIDEITSTIVNENQKKPLGLVIIDYDQKIKTADQGEQWRELHQAMEQIEEIAKFCEVPIILLAQGDDNQAVKASKRVTQSATAQFDFYYDERAKNYLLEAKKNRHGVYGRKIIVKYQPEMSLCQEGDYYEPPLDDPKETRNGRY